MTSQSDQLGFDALLQDAASDNRDHVFAKETAHLPETLCEAIAYHHAQIAEHHLAMLACDFDRALAIREEAHLLARKLKGGNAGILAHDDAPGYLLARECAAEVGQVPQWGQDGVFILHLSDMALQVTTRGMFGIGATAMTFLGFEVRALDHAKPFISGTGYRSFLGCSVTPEVDMSVDQFVRRNLQHHIKNDLKGRLVPIEARHQPD